MPGRVLVTGAKGFVGRALIPALLRRGHEVRATTRSLPLPANAPGLEWVRADVLEPESLGRALDGTHAAYYLVHSIEGGRAYRERDRRAARLFVSAAAASRLERIVYLGGVAPEGRASEHLADRLEVGEILRSGRVPTLELRASMVIGAGSASWQIVRDLALRLPVMVLPRWLRSRTRPIALHDVVVALCDALDVPLEQSTWFDLPGPEILSGRQILRRIVELDHRRLVAVSVPVLTPRVSSLWLKLFTRANYPLARELVAGLTHDLLPRDERYWELTHHPPRIPFDDAASRALAAERKVDSLWSVEEAIVRRLGRSGSAARTVRT